jgi:hypothetical protein
MVDWLLALTIFFDHKVILTHQAIVIDPVKHLAAGLILNYSIRFDLTVACIDHITLFTLRTETSLVSFEAVIFVIKAVSFIVKVECIKAVGALVDSEIPSVTTIILRCDHGIGLQAAGVLSHFVIVNAGDAFAIWGLFFTVDEFF